MTSKPSTPGLKSQATTAAKPLSPAAATPPAAQQSRSGLPYVDFAKVKAAAHQSVGSLVKGWLPGGARHGDEYVVLNPMRPDDKPGSFSIKINGAKAGYWGDFATGEGGRDLISLRAYLTRQTYHAAALEIAATLGVK